MNRKVIIITAILGVLVLGVGGYLSCTKVSEKAVPPAKISKPKVLTISPEILGNKFGFLSGGPRDIEAIKAYGALWVRPHPGPFLWDSMQKSKDDKISFSKTDKLVRSYQKESVGVLVTLWPFADWDQKERSDSSSYKVSENDEFLPRSDKEGGGDYLPEYRGNPNDWEAYKRWVRAMVERYDGDGRNDMPGLKIPIKYWEVMNEPDLEGPEEEKGKERLDFYKGDAQAYAELLIKTSDVIRKADPQAKVLIAGAAGGNDRFLDFYRQVFKNKAAISAFDIANVHCISNDDCRSFNVAPYQKMLEEFGINKPVWITEAEAMISDNPDINATQTLNSTKEALRLGAERIFFTRYQFEERFFGEKKPPLLDGDLQNIRVEIQGSDPREAYRIITSQ